MDAENKKMQFSRGVIAATAKHFKMTIPGVTRRIYKTYHLPTIEFAISEQNRILQEKELAKSKLHTFMRVQNG